MFFLAIVAKAYKAFDLLEKDKDLYTDHDKLKDMLEPVRARINQALEAAAANYEGGEDISWATQSPDISEGFNRKAFDSFAKALFPSFVSQQWPWERTVAFSNAFKGLLR